MTITIDIAPTREKYLRRQAQRDGLAFDQYIKKTLEQMIDEEIAGEALFAPTMPRFAAKRARRPYNQAGLVAALESFEQGDAEEQRQTLKYLETAIDRDRPGQRRIFGSDLNPMPTDEAA